MPDRVLRDEARVSSLEVEAAALMTRFVSAVARSAPA
jgi:hypothetical protein